MRHAGRRAWALRGVDLRVEAGERVLLVGASGAGKSTLLAGAAGLLDREGVETEGTILVAGSDPRRSGASTGVVFQDPEAQLVMPRVGDDVAFALENACFPGREIPARTAEALATVRFPYAFDRSTDALSGGEQQIVALAGALAPRPGLLLFDEPTANLDSGAATRLRRAVAGAIESRTVTLVVVEHRVEEWLDLVDRVVVLAGADGVADDLTPADLRRRDPRELTRAGVWAPGFDAPARRARGTEHRPPLIHAMDVRFRYPEADVDAVGPVTLGVCEAEALALQGPNGSGKSTLASMLGGLLRPTSGAVEATAALAPPAGRWRLADWRARDLVGRVGFVFQDPEHQFLARSVRTELEIGPRMAGHAPAAASAKADALLERLALEQVAEANPFTLSGGEKRRLSVATALAAAPALVILDEPTFGQDPVGWSELVALLGELRDEGTALAFATHDERFTASLADRVVDLGSGIACG